ncbi:LamG-like jellyroll fold domain-containing protein [Arthrobacter sp. 35W]|uniref:LamG-like jellyroll fold domain-containing protein n=1 Tax=Arthrobacter sp. 35W TaxID=1132441 RepID=UPI00040C60E1|nr:LamG-like jellyroll fold domain-containing protein [Arthrobacter sp. 35W]
MHPPEQAPALGGVLASGHPAAAAEPSEVMAWLRVLGAAVGRALLMVVVIMAAWAAAPALWGWQSTTVVSGSMEPAISVGDVVVAMPVGANVLTPGRVVLVDDPDHSDRLRLHRIVAVDPDGSLVLKGDANATRDSSTVWASAVHGVGFIRVPMIGLPIVWTRSGQWIKVAAAAGVLAGALALSTLDRSQSRGRRRTEGEASRHPRPGDAASARGAGRAVSVLLVLGGAAGLAWVPLAGASTAHAAFSGTIPNAANTLAARPYFSCTAAVLADSPSLFFAFNDDPKPPKTVTDSSTNKVDGQFQKNESLSTAVPCSGDTRQNPALSRSADLDDKHYISTGGSGIAGPAVFSCEMWFKTTSATGGKLAGFQTTQDKDTGTSDRNLYMLSDGRLVFGIAPGGAKTTIASPSGYKDGLWHHAAVTLSAAGMKLYVDGAVVASNAGATTAQAASSGWWRFGDGDLAGWPLAGATAFTGQVDNIAVYNGVALTPAQVLAHYVAGAP